MTAKIVSLKPALPEAPTVCENVVQAPHSFSLLLGTCFQITWHRVWNTLNAGKFVSFDSDLSLNKIPKVILKSNQLNVLGHFAG